MERFNDRTVIVTGAGSGIGEATARRFSSEGANVVLAGRNREKLDRLAAELPAERTLVQVTDVSKLADVQVLVEAAVARFGALHVLVNNAATAAMGSITELPIDDWEKTMRVNVDGVFFACRVAMPHLVKTKGCIVNTSSVSGLGGDWNFSAYNASKGAVTNFTKALALDAGADGVRVNAVCPSLTDTSMATSITSNEATMKKFMARIPMGRAAEPSDVASVIAFLASDDAGFVTGVALPVDGGLSASNGQPNLG